MRERVAILILGLAFGIRLFSLLYTAIINPDGVLYIHQARSIYYAQWDSILTCGIKYLSNYSIFIVGAYAIFRDWVVAAKSVSVIFGTLTLIPLYLLLSRLLRKQIAILASLVFAFIPVFVDKSADVVRDPVYWFFLVLGLYFFMTQIGKRNHLYLILSSLSFLMAAWARVEAVLFIFVSFLYMIFSREDKKIEKLSIFAAPVIGVILSLIFGLMIFNTSGNDLFRIDEIANRLSAPLLQYKNLRVDLTELMDQPLEGTLQGFLHKARNLVWLVALGTIVKYAITAFFYPFFLLFIIGLAGIWVKIREDPRILYLSILSASALILLYIHVLQTWMMFNRLLALFILPSFIVIGYGLEKIVSFFRSRLHLKESMAFIILFALIAGFSLPKNLKSRETDKLVFKEIGELIADREGNGKEIKVATALPLIRWISFYANLNHRGAPCPEINYDISNIMGGNYGEFIQNLKRRGIKYFLWDEKNWPKGSLSFIINQNQKDFIKLGAWSHPDTGKMILFKVI